MLYKQYPKLITTVRCVEITLAEFNYDNTTTRSVSGCAL